MSTTRVSRSSGGPGANWWLPVLLALLIIAIVAGAYLATHPHVFAGSATSTPTVTSTATPGPTATPRPGPTGTPKPGPTGTPVANPTSTSGTGAAPTAGPTGTPAPGPTSTPPSGGGLKLGAITYPQYVVQQIQSGANRNDPRYAYYRDPYQVIRTNLTGYGFTGGFTIVSAKPPSPTPTPHTSAQGAPEVTLDVKYNGKTYAVVLDQPAQHGPSGIWLIITISAV